ncbi:MAG: Rpn family recombination-promoting nuclease/putative transposase, partial [Eubacterium sp.]|nr:Rpn family recombination-promoting nuclease/putative transposase [Eubacterium sp.]
MVTEQKTMKNKRFGKGIRLDIYVKDQDGNVYDLEMQMTNTKELELRSRYYHSEMDGYQIKAGQPYNELKNSIVIFICDFDMFKRNRSVYTFVNQCVEEKDLILEDKRKTLFVNISGERVGLSEELSVLLDYLKTSEPKDEFTKGLDEEVKSVRKDQEWRENYMTWEMKLDYEYRMGEKAGIEKGIERGIKDLVTKKLAKGKSVSQIADECEETEEKIKRIIDEIEKEREMHN